MVHIIFFLQNTSNFIILKWKISLGIEISDHKPKVQMMQTL